MHTSVYCAALDGVRAQLVNVEVDVSLGLPAFTIVGLPEGAVRESKVRVLAALGNCDYDVPPRKITVNLAPADVKKSGSAFDLAIALAVLAGLGMVARKKLEKLMVVGELGLDGALKSVPGALPYALLARTRGVEQMLIASGNAKEAAVVSEVDVLAISNLPQAVMHLTGEGPLARTPTTHVDHKGIAAEIDMGDVRGQEHAKRALEVAAAGAHNLLMIGPPGSGETMLARRLSSILPELTFEEMLEVSAAHSVLGLTSSANPLVSDRPFRAPHHTVSDAGLVGGSNPPRPGEVSLAHNGILFLDELPEFKRHVLEVLENRSRKGRSRFLGRGGRTTFPATFTLVSSMNPCPCGYAGIADRTCTCMPNQVERYRGEISGPLLDRIDLHIDVPAVPVKELTKRGDGESSEVVRERVVAARERQKVRFKRSKVRANAQMSLRQINSHCVLDPSGQQLLERAIDRLGLSARAYARILKVSRTIADLEDKDAIETAHLAEAIGYRTLDRREI